MANDQQLPPKLEAVLIRLGRAARLNVTQAVKLPYLVDVLATHLLGRPITEGTHQTWEHGVVTSEAWHYLARRETSPVFHLEPVPWHEEKSVIIDADEPADVLTPEEATIIDYVIHEFSHIRAGDLGRMTKFMNPHIASASWGSNHAADLGADAFDHMSEEYQEMAKLIAGLTLDQLRRHSTRIDDIEDAVA